MVKVPHETNNGQVQWVLTLQANLSKTIGKKGKTEETAWHYTVTNATV
jgi:hypothetical protein